MRRERLGTSGLALLLLVASAAVAAPFRAESLRRLTVLSVSWDAALHALSGLDLFDDLRLLRPLDALRDVLAQHWWGPSFGIALVPSFALFGRSLASATLPSFGAYLLAAPVTFFAARRALGALGSLETATLAAIVGAFVLRSPMLLETSAWIMPESLGGLLAVAALGLFAARHDARARRAAFALGAALFLMKVHYGTFVLVTLGVATWFGEERETRRRLSAALLTAVRGRAAGVLAGLVALLVAGWLFLEGRGGDTLAHRLPSVSNVMWGVLVLSFVFVFARRPAFGDAWRTAPAALRDFALWGLAPVGAWCLDPANMRGWYRQIFQPTLAPFRPLAQLAAYLGFLREDYTLAALPFVLVLAGLVLALVLPGSAARRTLAAFATWPVLLMSLSRFPAEARFLGCLVPALFASSSSGLVAFAARLPRPVGRVALVAVIAALALALVPREADWQRGLDARATYRYPYDGEGEKAAARDIAESPRRGPIALVVPADPPVWPTVRLGIRLSLSDVAPRDVVVDAR